MMETSTDHIDSDIKHQLQKALFNGTFQKSLWEESGKKLAMLDESPNGDVEEKQTDSADITKQRNAEFTRIFTALISRQAPDARKASVATPLIANSSLFLEKQAQQTNQSKKATAALKIYKPQKCDREWEQRERLLAIRAHQGNILKLKQSSNIQQAERITHSHAVISAVTSSIAKSLINTGSSSTCTATSSTAQDSSIIAESVSITSSSTAHESIEESIVEPSGDMHQGNPSKSATLPPEPAIPAHLRMIAFELCTDSFDTPPNTSPMASLAATAIDSIVNASCELNAAMESMSVLSNKYQEHVAEESSGRSHSAYARMTQVLPAYMLQDNRCREGGHVSVNAFTSRLRPSASAGVERIRKMQQLVRGAAVDGDNVSHAPDISTAVTSPGAQASKRTAAFLFSLDCPPPALSLRASRALHEASLESFSTESASNIAAAAVTMVMPDAHQSPQAGSSPRNHCPANPKPSSERPTFRKLTLGSSKTRIGLWGGDAELGGPPPRKPVRAIRTATSFVRYPIHSAGREYSEVVFDPEAMTLTTIAIKAGAIVSMIDVEMSTVEASAGKLIGMVSLRSPQGPRDGYIGSMRAQDWDQIVDKARKAQLFREHHPRDGQRAKETPVGGLSPWERRRQILHDVASIEEPAPARHDRDDGLSIFGMTAISGEERHRRAESHSSMHSPLKTACGNSTSPRGKSSSVRLKGLAAAIPPYLALASSKSSSTLNVLLIESRDVMQIYFRVKLQPFFKTVDCCGSLGEALRVPKLSSTYSILFVNCLDIFQNDTPHDSLARLAGQFHHQAGKSSPSVIVGASSIKPLAFSSGPQTRLVCVYGVPNHAETGEEMLTFVQTLCSVGVTDILDEPFTYEQIQEVIAKVVS